MVYGIERIESSYSVSNSVQLPLVSSDLQFYDDVTAGREVFVRACNSVQCHDTKYPYISILLILCEAHSMKIHKYSETSINEVPRY